jgi:hypothetical protein
MTGVYIGVFILTFSCYGGPACFGLTQPQSVQLPSEQQCLFMKEALQRYPGPDRIVVADCHGEARERTLQELQNEGFVPTHR